MLCYCNWICPIRMLVHSSLRAKRVPKRIYIQLLLGQWAGLWKSHWSSQIHGEQRFKTCLIGISWPFLFIILRFIEHRTIIMECNLLSKIWLQSTYIAGRKHLLLTILISIADVGWGYHQIVVRSKSNQSIPMDGNPLFFKESSVLSLK